MPLNASIFVVPLFLCDVFVLYFFLNFSICCYCTFFFVTWRFHMFTYETVLLHNTCLKICMFHVDKCKLFLSRTKCTYACAVSPLIENLFVYKVHITCAAQQLWNVQCTIINMHWKRKKKNICCVLWPLKSWSTQLWFCGLFACLLLMVALKFTNNIKPFKWMVWR